MEEGAAIFGGGARIGAQRSEGFEDGGEGGEAVPGQGGIGGIGADGIGVGAGDGEADGVVDEHERDEETQHADAIIKRILFLEGKPDLNNQDTLNVGSDVVSMLQNDLALEYHVTGALKAVIKVCEEEQDYVSREMLEKQLSDTEEDHAYFLEKQLKLIKLIGLQNYLQSQM